jgi:hypothetical protein
VFDDEYLWASAKTHIYLRENYKILKASGKFSRDQIVFVFTKFPSQPRFAQLYELNMKCI